MNYFSTGFSESQSRFETRHRVLVLGNLDDMDRWADAWRDLDRRATSDLVFFQSFDWCRQWWALQARPGQHLAVHLVLQGNDLVAVLPLMKVRSRVGITVLRPLGEPHTQYANLLTPCGGLSGDAAEALGKALAGSGADLMQFNSVPCSSPLRSLLGEDSSVVELLNTSLQYDLSVHHSAAAYDASADKKQRQLRRRAETYLGKHGPLNLHVLKPGDRDYVAAVARCIDLKMVWISETARNHEGLGQPGHREFLASLPGPDLLEGAIVFALRSGETAIAYQMGFLVRGHYYLYTASFDWEMRAWSPGLVLIDMTMRWLIAHGAKTFDLMGNPSSYKERLANRQLELSGHTVALTAFGSLYGTLWTRLTRPLLRQIYHKTPTSLRRGINHLRQLSPV